jgi:hypothetical protein
MSTRTVLAKSAGEPQYAKELESQIEGQDTELRLSINPSATIASVLWVSYRCAMNSVQVAESFGLKPPAVRQCLYRCRIIGAIIAGELPQDCRAHKGKRYKPDSVSA